MRPPSVSGYLSDIRGQGVRRIRARAIPIGTLIEPPNSRWLQHECFFAVKGAGPQSRARPLQPSCLPYGARARFADGPVHNQENFMGKYFLAWLLGVPMFVLVIVYIFFH